MSDKEKKVSDKVRRSQTFCQTLLKNYSNPCHVIIPSLFCVNKKLYNQLNKLNILQKIHKVLYNKNLKTVNKTASCTLGVFSFNKMSQRLLLF